MGEAFLPIPPNAQFYASTFVGLQQMSLNVTGNHCQSKSIGHIPVNTTPVLLPIRNGARPLWKEFVGRHCH